MASECVARTTSCCCCATDTWLRVHSLDDHPVLDLVAQEHEKDCKLSRSRPHRCIRLSACILSFIFLLELCLQLCIHKMPKLIALCFLAVRVRNFGVERKRSRHRGQFSVTVEVVTNSSRSDLVFTKALLPCPLVLKRLLGQSHIFDSVWRLSSQRCVSTAQQYQFITPV